MDRDYLKRGLEDGTSGFDQGAPKTCLGCDYPLEGLGQTGKCPECGIDFGAELVYIGHHNPTSGVLQVLGVLGMVLLTAAFIISGGLLNFFSLLAFVATVGLAIRAKQRWVARRERGGDMKWIVNEIGIVMINADKKLPSKTRMLLPWKSIKSIRCNHAMGIGPRRWRALEVRRTFFSVDLTNRRDAPIWFKSLEEAEIEARREQVVGMEPETPPEAAEA